MRTNRPRVLATLTLACIAIACGCSQKVTDPADMTTTVVEVPDRPTEKEKRELFRKLEELKEYNEAFLEAPSAGQRRVAQKNLDKIAAAKLEIGPIGGRN